MSFRATEKHTRVENPTSSKRKVCNDGKLPVGTRLKPLARVLGYIRSTPNRLNFGFFRNRVIHS